MLIFELDDTRIFSRPLSLLNRLDDAVDFKATPTMLTLIYPLFHPRCIYALKFRPQFFPRFVCDRIHYVKISIEDLFMTMLDLQRNGFDSLILSLAEFQDHMTLEYRNRNEEHPLTLVRPVWMCQQWQIVGEADYGSFVSVDLEMFRRIVTGLDNAHHVIVTITSSQITFLVGQRMYILTTERDECIIGGVAEGTQIQSPITLYPMCFFYNFTTERIWLFPSSDSNGLLLIAPMGLYAHMSTYFPRTFHV